MYTKLTKQKKSLLLEKSWFCELLIKNGDKKWFSFMPSALAGHKFRRTNTLNSILCMNKTGHFRPREICKLSSFFSRINLNFSIFCLFNITSSCFIVPVCEKANCFVLLYLNYIGSWQYYKHYVVFIILTSEIKFCRPQIINNKFQISTFLWVFNHKFPRVIHFGQLQVNAKIL